MRGDRRRPPQLETLPGMERPQHPSGGSAPPAGSVARTGLTPEQQHAVDRRGEALALSAAAGSGKTSVLVERFVSAVLQDGTPPGRILAITFTERAAGELRERVRARLLELGERESARDTEAATIGTFHGFCARLLRTHSLAASLDPGFSILDEGLSGRLRALAFKHSLTGFMSSGGSDAVDLVAAHGVDRVEGIIGQVFAELRSRGERQPRLPVPVLEPDAGALDIEAARACELLDDLLARFASAYADLKAAGAAVDFDDLELLAGALLARHDGIRRAWAERFELLMVDEFQDTNPRQLAILRGLDRGNLFTVGDELQSIYGFRHADVSLFRARRAELREGGRSLALTFNFRSRQPLLDAVNTVFAGRFPDYVQLACGRGEDPVSGNPPDGDSDEPAVELLLTDTRGWEERDELRRRLDAALPRSQAWRQTEAMNLADRIAELVESGRVRPADVAVLLRASGDLDVFERALQLKGLRTLAAVGAFWGAQQVRDLIAYLRVLANPLDEEALYGALASPLAGCSRDCLGLIAAGADGARGGAWGAVWLAISAADRLLVDRVSERDREALDRFARLVRDERRGAPLMPISKLIERAIEATGYREVVLGLQWGERRLANVHKLLRLARRFEAREGRDLRGFLDHVQYLQEAGGVEPDAPVDGVEPDAVRLMTVHAAKGLEFPVVALADLGRQPYLHTPDLLAEADRIGLRLSRLNSGRSEPALDYDDLCVERRGREAEEEDRILYVAMTRARDRLLLSGAADFERWPTARPSAAPISWLGPALCPQLPAMLAAGEIPPADQPIGPGGRTTVRCFTSSPADPGSLPAGIRADAPAPAPGAGPGFVAATDSPGPGGRHPAAAPAPGSLAAPEGLPATAAASATVSYTSLAELERCGYRYYLERVLGLPEERAAARTQGGDRGLEARARGTLVHRLMESVDFAHPRPVPAGAVSRCADELGLRVAQAEQAEIARMIETAAGAALARRLAGAQSLLREHPFAFSAGAGEPLVTGVIDLLALEEGGGRLVVDYKSDRVGAEVMLEELVARDYGIQRLLYAIAVLREGVDEVEVIHWFLERPDEPAGARHSASERPALEAELAQRISSLRREQFAVSREPHRGLCLTCPGRATLCSWGEAETLRDLPPGVGGASADGA